MTPPDRHGSPLKIMMGCEKKNLGLPNSERAGAPSSSSRWQPQARGAPRFLCHQSVILVGKKKSPPLLPFFPPLPPTPRVSLISTPLRARLSASQRLPCAPRRREAGEKRVAAPQFNKHFIRRSSKAPCAFCWGPARACACGFFFFARVSLCVRVYCCERKTDGLSGQWLRGATHTPRWGKTHMDA